MQTVLPTEKTSAPNGNSPKTRPKHSKPFMEAVKLQRIMVEEAESGEVKPSDLAQMARAWESLERLKRDMRMKPNPSRIKPPVKPSKRTASQATFEE